jgi:hypothetical protein
MIRYLHTIQSRCRGRVGVCWDAPLLCEQRDARASCRVVWGLPFSSAGEHPSRTREWGGRTTRQAFSSYGYQWSVGRHLPWALAAPVNAVPASKERHLRGVVKAIHVTASLLLATTMVGLGALLAEQYELPFFHDWALAHGTFFVIYPIYSVLCYYALGGLLHASCAENAPPGQALSRHPFP